MDQSRLLCAHARTTPLHAHPYTIPCLTDWKTEWIYCFLSAGSKLTLGLLLYFSVLRFASFNEAMEDTPANRAANA